MTKARTGVTKVEDEKTKLEHIQDDAYMQRSFRPATLQKFIVGLETYLNILKPRGRPGADKINHEIRLVRNILAIVKDTSDQGGGVLTLSAGDYKLLSDILWKQYAILGQILRTKKETSFIEGELEPEEKEIEELKLILELPLFQYIPRRKTLVDDFADFYLSTNDKVDEKLPEQDRLVKDTSGKKYIVNKGQKFYIPNPETRNALGYDEDDFVLLSDEQLKNIPGDGQIDNVKSAKTRLVRTKESHNEVFVVFKYPKLHRRHIPDEDTLKAIGRRQDQAEVISETEMKSIEEAEAIKPADVRKATIIQQKEIDKNITNIFNAPVGVNIGSSKGKVAINEREQVKKKWWESPLFLTILGILGSILVAYLVYRLGWNK